MKAAPRPCSIADTLALVGEKYSLLVLREIDLGGRGAGTPWCSRTGGRWTDW